MNETATTQANESREESLARRRTGIGGSDAAAIVGKSPWKTIHEVYCDKLGLTPPMPMTERMEAGIRLEPVIADWFAAKTDSILIDGGFERSKDHACLIAHPDRMIVDGDGKVIGGLECKSTDARFAADWGEDGTDVVPDYYNLQCQHYMMVTGLQQWQVAVLIGGNDFRVLPVPRHDGIIKILLERELEFWNYNIKNAIPPDTDGTVGCAEALRYLYPADSGIEIESIPDVDVAVAALNSARREIDRCTGEKIAAENIIKAFMGEAAKIVGPDYHINYKKSKDREVTDWKTVALDLLNAVGQTMGKDEFVAEIKALFDEHVQSNTTTKTGPRVFRPGGELFKKEK